MHFSRGRRWWRVGVIAGPVIAAVLAIPTIGLSDQCDNGANAAGCEVPYTSIPASPVILGIPGQIEISPVNLDGDSSCTATDNACGFNAGTGPVAVGGDASCRVTGSPNDPGSGCGFVGTGPVAVGGSSYCEATFGCGQLGTGPIAVGGDATCQGGSCGFFGTAPIAVGGSVTCATYTSIPSGSGCGDVGTGPVAVGGGIHCRTGIGCGATATGPVAVGGPVDCKAGQGCGAQGTGVVAVGGDARCEATTGCGYVAPGPIAVGGDVYCTGTCGKRGPLTHLGLTEPSLPRRGTPGISVTGHAYCSTPLSVLGAAADPVGHPQDVECASPRDVAGL